MMTESIVGVISAIGMLVSGIVAVLVYSLRAELTSMRMEFKKELVETEHNIVNRIDNAYVRQTICDLRQQILNQRIDALKKEQPG